MKVRIQKETLTDRSHVFNVAMIGHGQTYILHATSERDAEELADKITNAVNEHSIQVAKLAFA